MGSPVRFPFGVTNAAKDSVFGAYRAPSPLLYHEDFDDFNRFAAAEWTITRVGTTPTEALTDGNGGLLLLTAVASASSSTYLQKVGGSFLPAVGKPMFFATRLKVSDATDSVVQAGLILTDTTPNDATDGMFFLKPAASLVATMYCRKDATTGSTSVAVGSLANDTFVHLGFYYDGKRTMYGWLNDAVKRLDLSASPTAYLPDTTLRVSFGVANGASTARTATVDYVYAAIER